VIRCLAALLASTLAAAEPSLHGLFRDRFAIGMALSAADIRDPAAVALAARHIGIATAENALKMAPVQPREGVFAFADGDAFVDLCRERGWRAVGHALVWHQQAPEWIFRGPDGAAAGRDLLLARMRAHIAVVAGRYAGRIEAWDVVNEALADGDGAEDLRDSPWSRACGPDFIVEAFRAAAAADPGARLFYNDYNIESEPKRSRAVRLVRRLRAAGVRIDGIGIQGHWGLEWPPVAHIDEAVRAFAAEGLEVHISELDIGVIPQRAAGADLDARAATGADPWRDGLPAAVAEAQARRYGEIFRCLVANADRIGHVTFWNVYDGRSWLNDWPVRGRTDHPLLFDRALAPKPAFWAVVAAAGGREEGP
jgi:endo-1,4-beta-xylanase